MLFNHVNHDELSWGELKLVYGACWAIMVWLGYSVWKHTKNTDTDGSSNLKKDNKLESISGSEDDHPSESCAAPGVFYQFGDVGPSTLSKQELTDGPANTSSEMTRSRSASTLV